MRVEIYVALVKQTLIQQKTFIQVYEITAGEGGGRRESSSFYFLTSLLGA